MGVMVHKTNNPLKRLTKTPLSLGRFLLFVVFFILMLDIFIQLFSGKDRIDVPFTLGLVIGYLVVFTISELITTHRWIIKTVLIQVDCQQDECLESTKPTVNGTEVYGFIALMLPIILAIVLLSGMIDPTWLFLAAAAILWITGVLLLVGHMKKKRGITAKKIILSKVGMIYLNETILWADLRGLVYIESGEVVDSERGFKLVLNIMKTYRYLQTTQTYTIPIRERSLEEINQILETVISASVKG
jgi:hypothetical protein